MKYKMIALASSALMPLAAGAQVMQLPQGGLRPAPVIELAGPSISIDAAARPLEMGLLPLSPGLDFAPSPQPEAQPAGALPSLSGLESEVSAAQAALESPAPALDQSFDHAKPRGKKESSAVRAQGGKTPNPLPKARPETSEETAARARADRSAGIRENSYVFHKATSLHVEPGREYVSSYAVENKWWVFTFETVEKRVHRQNSILYIDGIEIGPLARGEAEGQAQAVARLLRDRRGKPMDVEVVIEFVASSPMLVKVFPSNYRGNR